MLNGVMPPFDPEGGTALIGARVVADAALMQVFGTAVARLSCAGPGLPPVLERRLTALLRIAAAAALVAMAAWLWLQTGDFLDARPDIASVVDVMRTTWFGQVLSVQLGLTALVFCFGGSRPRWWVAAIAGACALSVEALHGHAWAMRSSGGSDWLVASVAVHLLAAGAWLGGLLPLVVLLAEPARWRVALTRFSKLGYACVAAVAVTAGAQAWVLVGGLPGLFGTAYGWVALAKLTGFGVLVGIACVNRWRLGPRRSASLRRVIVAETVVGFAVVAAAGLLSSLPPAMHTQPVWPFDWRPTLSALREAPEFRAEVAWALVAIGVATALAGVALVRRRWWLALLGVAALIGTVAAPHLGLLFAEATPATYATSPTGFTAASIALGASLYPGHCASCHGATGAGDGPAAPRLSLPPANLLADHLWGHPDGELFWWVSHGIADPADPAGTRLVMPPAGLDDDAVWALIDFLRARNAGHAASWPAPVSAPGFGCPTRDSRVTLSATTVRDGNCVNADPTALAAYRLLLGNAPVEVVVDHAGWLRDVRRPGWPDAASAAASVVAANAHPLAAADPAMHHHM